MFSFMCLTLLNVVTLTFSSSMESSFTVQQNVDMHQIDLKLAFHHQTGPTASSCSLSCVAQQTCISAVFDKDSLHCHLFNSTQNVLSAVKSSAVYLESRCQHQHTGEDCCIGYENTACLPGHTGVYKDCQEAFENGEKQSGIFHLQSIPQNKRLKVWCDFDGIQGWTVIQKRFDGSVDFHRNWNSYLEGFGFVDGEYWFGLENIYYITRENRNLSIFLEAHDGETRTANYSDYQIEDANTNYILRISGYSGDAGDSFTSGMNLNGHAFSTYDKDNDGHSSSNCALNYEAGWWFHRCHRGNLNGVWHASSTTSTTGTGIIWNTWKGIDYSLRTVVMRVGR